LKRDVATKTVLRKLFPPPSLAATSYVRIFELGMPSERLTANAEALFGFDSTPLAGLGADVYRRPSGLAA
jgi:hypothetical protein